MTTAPALPRTADEFADAIYTATTEHDPYGITDPKNGRQNLRQLALRYAEAHRDRETIERQVQEQVDRRFAEIFRTQNLGDVPGMLNRLNLDPHAAATPTPLGQQYNPKAPGAALDAKFGDWGSYLAATWDGANTTEAVQAKAEIAAVQNRFRNAFGSTIPADGGFLIPERLRSELLRVSLESAVVRPRARVVPMDSLTVPYPMIDATSNASSVYGGIVGYWTAEGQDLQDSNPSFGRIDLVAKKLTLYSEIPNELFSDSIISLNQFLSESFPEALAWFEDIAFIRGSGAGEPLGFLNAPAAVTVAKESGQPADTIVWENLVKMYSRMLPASIGRAVWIAHIDTFPELATMALSVGTGGSAVWIGEGQGAGAPPMTILGRPVIFTEKVETVGDPGDINFVDLGYYLIGDRQAMQSSTSTDFKFGSDKTALRVIERVDGTPWIKSAITPHKGSNTLSPFVKLAARA